MRSALMQAYSRELEILKRHEGFSPVPYECSTGHLTIGYGHRCNPGQQEIDEDTAEHILNADWMSACYDASELCKEHRLDMSAMPSDVLVILGMMVFQMGKAGVRKFRNMWAALAVGNYIEAAKEMLDSQWARQTPNRAQELAGWMQQGAIS